MRARDELARDIFVADNSNAKDPAANWQEGPASIRDYAYAIANELLAAGYRKQIVIEPEHLRIENGYLVAEVKGCTCGAGGPESNYAHENGCGLEPLADITDALERSGYRKAPEPEIEWGTRTKWGSRAAINRENAVDYIQLCDLDREPAVLIKREAASQPGPWEDA